MYVSLLCRKQVILLYASTGCFQHGKRSPSSCLTRSASLWFEGKRRYCTNEHKVQCCFWFDRFNSPILVKRLFYKTFHQNPPSSWVIGQWYKKLRSTGSVKRQRGSGKPSISDRHPRIAEHVQQAYQRSSTTSLRKGSSQLGVSCSFLHRVLKKTLRLKAFRVQTTQKLKGNDRAARKAFAEDALRRNKRDGNFITKILPST